MTETDSIIIKYEDLRLFRANWIANFHPPHLFSSFNTTTILENNQKDCITLQQLHFDSNNSAVSEEHTLFLTFIYDMQKYPISRL
jgi:predicted membrane protein